MDKKTFIKEINNAYRKSSKLQAVKIVNDYTGWGLKKSKEFCDEFFVMKGKRMPGSIMLENIEGYEEKKGSVEVSVTLFFTGNLTEEEYLEVITEMELQAKHRLIFNSRVNGLVD